MKDLRFVFAVHNHQPVGNFESVIVQAFEDCYRPFLELVQKHPGFRLSIHFSGPLWEHMEKNEPACWNLMKEMTGRGQVELLSGGFYEPILSIIPERDRIGQISLMNEFIGRNFGQKPRGLWLTERVWEPTLPKSLAEAGIEYTLLDEEHFRYAGVRDFHATYITEDEGNPLRVFPIDKTLRYMIPFQPLEALEDYLRKIHGSGGAAILGDDGEKFGVWPGTRQWVYEEGWLERFLTFIGDRGVRMMTCSEFLDESPPGGRVYLPPASYEEMMEWVLEPEEFSVLRDLKEKVPAEARRFIRGGFFRDFFRKYAEANHLHKRMILVSREVQAAGEDPTSLRELYQGQCNDPYWHGVFGGLYLPHLREAAYHHLLEAERRSPAPQGWKALDFDLDSRQELFLRGQDFNLLVKPSFGGSLAEIDYLPLGRNISDVLSRRPESYHKAEGKDAGEGRSIHDMTKTLPAGSEELLSYDWHPRYSLLDHFLHSDSTEEDFRKANYGEQGDFINLAYEPSILDNALVLERRGGVWVGAKQHPVALRKWIALDPGELRVTYEIENLSPSALCLNFGSEWNLLAFPDEVAFHGVRGVDLYGGRLSLIPEAASSLWTFPLRTLSQSEEGFDIIHQGYCLMPVWVFVLAANAKFRFGISLKEIA